MEERFLPHEIYFERARGPLHVAEKVAEPVDIADFESFFNDSESREDDDMLDRADIVPPVIRGYHLCGCLPYKLPKPLMNPSPPLSTLVIPSLLLALLPFTARAASSIAITEIGAYESSGHEWVEIANVGTSSTDLAAWKFFEDDTNHNLKIFRGSTELESGAYAIVAQNAEQTATDYPNFTGTIFDSSWGSLNESGELIGLRDASGTLVESLIYPESHTASLERIDPIAPPEGENWRERSAGNSIGLPYQEEVAATSSLLEPQEPLEETTSSTSVEVEVASSTPEIADQPAPSSPTPEPIIVRVPVYEPTPIPNVPILPKPRVPKPAVRTIKRGDTTVVVVEVPYVYERIIVYLPQEVKKEPKEPTKLKASATRKSSGAKKTLKKSSAPAPVVTLEGEVLEHSSRNFILEKGGEEIFVQLPTKASKRAMRVGDGDRVRVTGTRKEESDGSTSLKMRGPKDLVILERATSTAMIAPKTVSAPVPPQNINWPYLGAAGIGSALLAGHLAMQKKKNKNKKLSAAKS